MSFPNVPNITPLISVTTEQTIPLLLSSIALEELALAHIMNAEAEKLQMVLGTLDDTGVTFSPPEISVGDLLEVNASVRNTLRNVIKKEMLLEFKFENVLDLIRTIEPGILEQRTFEFTGNIQTTVVPARATFAIIQAVGASGGTGVSAPGLGASIQGDFTVTPGETLSVLVGGQGITAGPNSAGGGGGSFVWRTAGAASIENLLVAAGGGGGGSNNPGVNAVITPNGTSGNPGGAGGAAGNGGAAGFTGFPGAGGGGILTSGANTIWATGGQAISLGGAPGQGFYNNDGGFGGGGGGGNGSTVTGGGGGGGGSQNNGTNQINNAGAGTGNGQISISFFGF
ncbi:hypothetical protein M3204_01710 [Mesobacillus subterraneus]|uniref:hypothetical protein n=1 Tax=Mesobacillus subterraneus TaxID=285983 RepID=UPI00204168DB|nr:hypothetical protein [Mesobacillus subterraneus]MCM3663101.1 hypothetical protein [Mesobacillus subterraneus]MCM3682723.1 hypothetical protein [Mesobacillus subterraneus]